MNAGNVFTLILFFVLTCYVALVGNNHKATVMHLKCHSATQTLCFQSEENNNSGPMAAYGLKYEPVYWILLLPVIALPSSMVSQVGGRCDGRD